MQEFFAGGSDFKAANIRVSSQGLSDPTPIGSKEPGSPHDRPFAARLQAECANKMNLLAAPRSIDRGFGTVSTAFSQLQAWETGGR